MDYLGDFKAKDINNINKLKLICLRIKTGKSENFSLRVSEIAIFIDVPGKIIRYFNPNGEKINILNLIKKIKKKIFKDQKVKFEYNKDNPFGKTSEDFFQMNLNKSENYFSWLNNPKAGASKKLMSDFWVYDPKNKSIVLSKNILKKDIGKYKKIYVEKLEKIAKSNSRKLRNFIKKRDQNELIHLTTHKIDQLQDTTKDQTSHFYSTYHNPKGLWVSCGLSWLNWAEKNFGPTTQWGLATYVYSITPSRKVYKISSLEEFKKFIYRFKSKRPDPEKSSGFLDWTKIKRRYHGLIICPYLGNEIWGEKANTFYLDFYGEKEAVNSFFEKLTGDPLWKKNFYILSEWYRHWETATGVIWNPRGIKKLELIFRTEISID